VQLSHVGQISAMAVAAAETAEEGGHGAGLTPHVFFHIGPIPVIDQVFSAWVVMAVLLLIAFLATRNLQMVPRGLQNAVELLIETWMGMIKQTAGANGRKFYPVVLTAFIYILAANWIGTTPFFGNIRGFQSPNSNLSMTAAMAIVVFFLVQFFAIKTLGVGGYLKEFLIPNPLHILTELSRPLSLSLRLFGNIYAGGVLVHTMLLTVPGGFLITWVFLGLELFVGVVQALIFTMLTLVFLSIANTSHHAHDDSHDVGHAEAHH
jgi:F-type H+-transporting ATPase subunit a